MATIIGDSGNNTLNGTTGNDLIDGLAGNDILNGGSGNDVLNGGFGFDTANYSSLGQAITVLPQGKISAGSLGGTDNLSNIEKIIGATGQANAINGSSGTGGASFTVNLTANSLIVDDIPGLGSIPFTVENFVNVTGTPKNDTITGNSSNNVLIGGDGADILNGFVGNDYLDGSSGDDILDGGAGIDTLIGGAGNDSYVVDTTTDILSEAVSAGTDTVQSSVSFTLGANLENLTLTGIAAINGTGNTLNNTLIGNVANNVLDGGAGIDTLIGGAGDDTYVVDTRTDILSEAVNAGTDTVQSSVSFTLGANLENRKTLPLPAQQRLMVQATPLATLSSATSLTTF